MTQAELIERLSQCKTWKEDLTPALALAEKMGNPQNSLKFVHVGGTNGKGSTCAMTASILEKAGYKTGRFISPYIIEFRERIQINGEMIPEEDLCRLGEQVLAAAEELENEEIYPTEFDVVTVMGMLWFAEQKCDIVVLEVGLGGAIDSTNIVTAESVLATAITSISIDHAAILGETEEEIAAEKSGIIKESGSLVLGKSIPRAALNLIKRVAMKKNCDAYMANAAEVIMKRCHTAGLTFWYKGRNYDLSLPGLYQLQNAVVSLRLVEVLRSKGWEITEDAVAEGLAHAHIPARMELMGTEPLFWIDGAHNQEGVTALLFSLSALVPHQKKICIHGMMQDKDCEGVVKMLSGAFDKVVTVTPSNPRAMQAEELADLWKAENISAEAAENVEAAIAKAVELAGADGVVVCCGSLFLCADVRPYAKKFFEEK